MKMGSLFKAASSGFSLVSVPFELFFQCHAQFCEMDMEWTRNGNGHGHIHGMDMDMVVEWLCACQCPCLCPSPCNALVHVHVLIFFNSHVNEQLLNMDMDICSPRHVH